MASVFDGKWTSFIVRNGDRRDDDPFEIEVTADELEPKSKHGAKPIKGKVKQGKAYPAIRIRHTDDESLEYRGILIADGVPSMICGIRDTDPDSFGQEEGVDTEMAINQERERMERRAARLKKGDVSFFGQEQEIWVATKP